jgi:hypothetical protein
MGPNSLLARATLMALVCLFTQGFLHANSPGLGGVAPRGIQRGTEAELVFSGARLANPKEVVFYNPGIQVLSITPVNDSTVKVKVKTGPDCRIGEHPVRLRTALGITEVRSLFVDPLPDVAEKEPNSDFTKPQKINLNTVVNGVVDNEDVDYFAVDLKKGQRLSAEVFGMRLGGTFFDPYIAILDSKRFELIASDDSPIGKQDGMCSIVAPDDGTYIVQVRETSYGGNGACQYRLHIGNFPRPTAMVPAGGKPGEELDVTFLGDPSGPIKKKVKIPADAPANFAVHAQDATGISPSGLPFRVVNLANVLEVEPNDTPAQASTGPGPVAFNGVIGKPGDVDIFKFPGKKGQVFDVHCYARRLGSPLDSVMYLAVEGAAPFASADDAVGPDSFFRVTLPEDKNYILTIQDHLKKGGTDYSYRVEFTSPTPKSTLSIPKVALFSQERQTITVHKGNRMASLMSVGRAEWGGDATLRAENLPPGATFACDTMPANLDTIPVVIEAAADAKAEGRLSQFRARPSDPKQPEFPSQFNQQADLIIGPPNQTLYWKYDLEAEAVAVGDEVPFKITVVEPKCPLVQNGSMQLRIIAERKPGFTAPINVYPLFNPPGVSTQGSNTIPEKGTETTLTINAAPNAQIKAWKTAIIANATVAGGPAWVSSQLFTLNVAAPFFAMAMERGAVEQGKETEIPCKITITTPITTPGKVKIVGLPPKVIAPELDIKADTKELVFKLQVDKTAPAGKHGNIFCQAIMQVNGEPVVHNVGGTELRIDVPIPPKVTAAAPAPMPMGKPAPAPVAQPIEKRLTRLEKLRLEQAEREKQGK